MRAKFLLLASVLASISGAVSAARIYVTTPSPGIGTGACSLQEAIYSSVLHDTLDGVHGIAIDATDQGTPPDHFITTGCVLGDGDDTIVLPTDGMLTMKSSLDGDAYNYIGPTATPLIFSTITIEGNGAMLQLDATVADSVRLFAIGAASIKTPNGTAGGIGSLTLRNVYVKGFHVKGGDGGAGGGGGGLGAGGAIYLQNGSLVVEGSTFEGNEAFGGKGNGTAGGPGGGGGGGLSGSGGRFGGGGGGARGDGGDSVASVVSGQSGQGGGGGGGTVFSGGAAYVGGPGGYLGGGNGGGPGNDGARAKGAGGGGGGGGYCPDCGPVFTSKSGNGGDGDYGGGGGGGAGNGGHGGFGGGGGAGDSCLVNGCGGDGGFGGGGAGDGGVGGAFGGNGAGDRILGPSGGGGAALGGAIFSDSGTVIIRNSTFTGNTVIRGLASKDGLGATNGADAGGAIFSRFADLTILNSTFSGNQSTGSGGGVAIYMSDLGSDFIRLTLDNSIFANNGANECLFTGNVHTQGAGNLIMSNGSGAQPFGACPGVAITDDPQLGPRQDNGGFTPTMAIPFGSVAMGAADPSTSLSTDQRGQARPQANGYDIGAYEVCRRLLAGGMIQPMFCSETTFAGDPTSPLTIQSSTSSGGTVSPAPGTYTVPQNTVEVLSATPAPGYYLKNWSGNVAQPNSLTTTIIIGNQAQTVTANFQQHDFTLSASPTSFALPLGGTTAISTVTASALGDFADAIKLIATGHPAGVTASLGSNSVTPVVGTPATSALTIAVGPSVTPLSFTEAVTGNSTGLSGALTHSAQINVTFVITPDALLSIINQELALGCIVNAGLAQSLTAKVNAYKTLAGGGHPQGATNVLAAFQYEVQAQIGHNIVTSCKDPVGGNAFSPGQTLIADAQALQATLGTPAKAAPVVGSVVSTSDAGTAGRIVNLLSGKSVITTAATDAVGFYYFDSSALKQGGTYNVLASIPKGYKASSPASQAFTWSGGPVKLTDFVLN